MVQNTDELLLEKTLQERLRCSQQTLAEAIRQRDQARLDNQRLILASRNAMDCRNQIETTLCERLRDIKLPDAISMKEAFCVGVDMKGMPNTWDIPRLFDVNFFGVGGSVQIQFWLKEYTDNVAVYEVCRLS
jgi:hypothetical protein